MAASTSASLKPITGDNFAAIAIGDFADVFQYTFASASGLKADGKLFLKQLLGLTSAEISINALPAKKSVPFYHKHHQNEEVYLFLQGSGEFQVDDCVFPVSQGSIVRVSPDGERCLRNVSEVAPLCWVVVQAQVNSQSRHTIEDGVSVEKRVSWVGKQRL